jgi:hypothetical protein
MTTAAIRNFILPSVVPPAKAIKSILDSTLDRLRNGDSVLAKLQAVRHAAEALHPFGDAAIEARDLISDAAISTHDVDPDAVQTAFAQGVEMAQNIRPPKPLVEPAVAPAPAPTADWWRKELIDVQKLCDAKFPEVRYVVQGMFPEGVTLLASRPKLGKSWLLLQIGTGTANSTPALVSGTGPNVIAGDVLYLALEDSPRRIQRRLKKLFGPNKSSWPSRLKVVTKWRRLDQGGAEAIRAWCASVEKPALVMIDTLKRVRPPRESKKTDYDADYEACQSLQDLAGDLGIAIILAHHDRKMDADDVFDTISGTLGLTAGVDAIAVMKRRAGAVTLHIQGRDLEEDVEKAIRVQP